MAFKYQGNHGWGGLGWLSAFLLFLVGIWFATDWGVMRARGTRDIGPEIERARRLMESGDARGSEGLYSLAIGVAPERGDAFLGRASCRVRLRDFKGVLEDLDRAEALGIGRGDVVMLRARARVAMGEYRAALPDLALAVGRPEDKAEALLLRGAVLKDLGDLDGAVRDLDELIRANPLQPLAFLMRAEAHLLAGRFESALADYGRVPSALLESAGGLFGRGLARLGIGWVEEAIRDFDAARGAGVDARVVAEAKALASGGPPRLGPEEILVWLKRSRTGGQAASGGVSRGNPAGGYPVR